MSGSTKPASEKADAMHVEATPSILSKYVAYSTMKAGCSEKELNT